LIKFELIYSNFLGWTKEEAIDSLLRKSGYNGRITDRIRSRVILTRYQSAKYVITYQEYLQFVGENPTKHSTKHDNRKPKSSKYLIDEFAIDEWN
jgi:hypothetical protein